MTHDPSRAPILGQPALCSNRIRRRSLGCILIPLTATLLTLFAGVTQAAWESIDADVSVLKGRGRYDFVQHITYLDARLRNQGDGDHAAPIRLVIEGISDPLVTLHQPDGHTDAGEPYLEYSSLLQDQILQSGETSAARRVSFDNPSRRRFVYTTRVEKEVVENQPPRITSDPVTEAVEDDPYQYQVIAEGPEPADPLTFSLDLGPTGMSIGPATGLLQWAPGADDLGDTGVSVTVADGEGLTDTQRFVLRVDPKEPNQPPVLDPLPDTLTVLGRQLSVTTSATDPNGDPLTFDLPQAPHGMTIDPLTGAISWMPSPDRVGDNAVIVRVTDRWGAADLQPFTASVEENLPPVAIDDRYAVTLGQTLSVVAPGVLGNDSDPNDDDLFASLLVDALLGDLSLLADGAFDYTPYVAPADPLALDLQYHWTDVSSSLVSGNPVIVDLDGDGTPEIVFVTLGAFQQRYLRAISGADGSEVFKVSGYFQIEPVPVPPDPPADWPQGYALATNAHLAAGDIDLDGRPEILVVDSDDGTAIADRMGREYYAFEHDGSMKYVSEAIPDGLGIFRASGPTIADLDGDGAPEILFGHDNFVTAYDSGGNILWTAEGPGGEDGGGGMVPVVADIDLDGDPEVLYGEYAYGSDGTPLWRIDIYKPAFTAVANLDDDPEAEIVWSGGHTRVYEHDGTLKWGHNQGLKGGGPPLIADLTGDGLPNIGVGIGNSYTVFDRDGSIVWTRADAFDEAGGGQHGATAIDLDEDGAFEIVYHDRFNVVILNGADGSELARSETIGRGSRGGSYPQIADVDADGHAEIVAASGYGVAYNGIYVLANDPESWPDARRIWNQHSYQVTNVNEDGTIPSPEQTHWLTPGLNKFPVNAFLPGERDTKADFFEYAANDGALESDPAEVRIDILPPNNVPVILSQAPSAASPGYELRYLVLAVDPNPFDTLLFELAEAPPGMAIDPTTGLIDWTPEVGQLGSRFDVTVKVCDQLGAVSYQRFSLPVLPPVLVPNVLGQSLGAAETQLLAQGLGLGGVTSGYDPVAVVDTVALQIPAAGTVVAAASAVDLVLSRGPEPVEVPRVQGLVSDTADQVLADADLDTGALIHANSDDFARDTVIDQTPPAGDLVAPQTEVDLTVSAGPSWGLRLDRGLVSAGGQIGIVIEAFDANGDPILPVPAADLSILSDPAESSGTPPSVVGNAVVTYADSRGIHRLRATSLASGEVAEAAFIVLPEAAAGGQPAIYSDLSAALTRIGSDYQVLNEALAQNDLIAVDAIVADLLAARDGIDLPGLRATSAFAPEGGFLPDLDAVIAAGFPETPEDTAFHGLAGALIERLAEIQSFQEDLDLDSPFDEVQRLRDLVDALTVQVEALETTAPTLHGMVLSADRLGYLLAVRIPELVHAQIGLTERILRDQGLIALRSTPAGFFARIGDRLHPGGAPPSPAAFYADLRPASFTLIDTLVVQAIQNELEKLTEQIFIRIYTLVQTANRSLSDNGLLVGYDNQGQVIAVITGASLQFNIFNRDNSVIEVMGTASEFADRVVVYLVGPETLPQAAAVLGGIDASTVQDLDDLHQELQKVATAARGIGGKYDSAFGPNSTPSDILSGCLFDGSPACGQVLFAEGFRSVHKTGSVPAPCLIVVSNPTTGQFGVYAVPFLPDPE